MGLPLDAIYGLTAIVTAPWWMRKARSDWGARFGRIEPVPRRSAGAKRLLIHAVSVGEVNLIRPFVNLLPADLDLVIAATTDTGISRARELYAKRCPVVRYPLDASWSIRRFLDAVRPDAIALVELELWPHLMDECARREIPVAVINGRLSARSFRNYKRARFFMRKYFEQLAFAAVQDESYAERFVAMGVPRERCHVVGTMKWDAAEVTDQVAGADELAAAMRIDRSRPLIVAGSTAPGEHELLHGATPQGVQLLCAPRRPEWFDGAAVALAGCIRRSTPNGLVSHNDRYLLDTIGELRKAYALADVVVIGRSFGDLHGSDPMEPAALAKAIVIGPAVTDFQTTVDAMLRENAIVQCEAHELKQVLSTLISDQQSRDSLSTNARACVIRHQGSSKRHLELVSGMLASGGVAARARLN